MPFRPIGSPAALPRRSGCAGTSRPTSFAAAGSTAPTSSCPTGSLWRAGSTSSRRGEKIYFSQVQGRTYANMFGLVERFIGAKVLELSRDHWLGDQVALEALVRFGDEELKHQALFRRVEALTAEVMPPGYGFAWDPNQVAAAVLSKSSWAVLALTLHIELFTQSHYRESIREDAGLSELYQDVFMFHWKEECQHATVDELEWRRLDAGTSAPARDKAVDELIELIGAVDGIVQGQAAADARVFRRDLRAPAARVRGRPRPADAAGGLSPSIHPLGRPPPPLRQHLGGADNRRPARAHLRRRGRSRTGARAGRCLNHSQPSPHERISTP